MSHGNYNNYSISPLLIHLTFHFLRESNACLAFVVPVMKILFLISIFCLFYYAVSVAENEFGGSGRGMF
jgi:hypothetical protein